MGTADARGSMDLGIEQFEEQYSAYTTAVSGKPLALNHLQARLLADIKVPVHVEVGELTLSAEEVIDLAEEQVINFELNPAAAVSLRVGSETVAKGRLAVCEGRLVVQVMSITSDLSSESAETLNEKPTTIKRGEKNVPHQDYYNSMTWEKENSNG